ncbi:MAG: hypothetical protein H7Y04_12185 [Verrucomicrobia bacterium]|nr:hypothetical protein [Cytophagales bacterium]
MNKIIFVSTLAICLVAFKIQAPTVFVYTQNNCPDCVQAITAFKKANIAFTERNLTLKPAFRKPLYEKLQNRKRSLKTLVFPVIETPDDIYTSGIEYLNTIVAELTEETEITEEVETPDNQTVASADTEPENMKGMVARHNYWRSQLKVGGLVWSDKLAAVAQDWANTLAKKSRTLEHRPNNKYGENIYWSSGMNSTPNNVVDSWADERKDFDFVTQTCRGGWYPCGHYTQVIWENTTEVGCAVAKRGSEEYWVCNYNPPGNYTGQKPYKKK